MALVNDWRGRNPVHNLDAWINIYSHHIGAAIFLVMLFTGIHLLRTPAPKPDQDTKGSET